jgi:Fanconi anemia group J protein
VPIITSDLAVNYVSPVNFAGPVYGSASVKSAKLGNTDPMFDSAPFASTQLSSNQPTFNNFTPFAYTQQSGVHTVGTQLGGTQISYDQTPNMTQLIGVFLDTLRFCSVYLGLYVGNIGTPFVPNTASGEKASLSILGYPIWYPPDRKPFPPQVALTSKIVSALSKKQNALLESPTGTGKTLALLTTTLCWQRQAIKNTGNVNRIFYCSRTHSQLKQVVKELRNLHPNCRKDMKMVVLGSRNQLCNNQKAIAAAKESNESINESCKELLKKSHCPLYYFSHKVAAGLKAEVIWDIEDAIRISKKQKGCGYYGVRNQLADNPHIVLAPYNYLVDPGIRARMSIDTTGAIIIFDEGHNLEDVCRSVASCELELNTLGMDLTLLRLLAEWVFVAFKSLLSLLHNIETWLKNAAERLIDYEPTDSYGNWNHGRNQWRGPEILDLFEEDFGLNEASLNVYWEHFQTVIAEQEAAAERLAEGLELRTEEEEAKMLTGFTVLVLESVLNVLRFMLQNERLHASDYYVVVDANEPPRGRNQRRSSRSENESKTVMTFHCLSASVAFADLTANSHAVLVTSGTLSPMDSFAGC